MREFEIKEGLFKKILKISKKDKLEYERIMKKINEIVTSPDIEHYKNLRKDLKDLKRVQIGHFVLVFSYNKTTDFISFQDYDHHDKIYKK